MRSGCPVGLSLEIFGDRRPRADLLEHPRRPAQRARRARPAHQGHRLLAQAEGHLQPHQTGDPADARLRTAQHLGVRHLPGAEEYAAPTAPKCSQPAAHRPGRPSWTNSARHTSDHKPANNQHPTAPPSRRKYRPPTKPHSTPQPAPNRVDSTVGDRRGTVGTTRPGRAGRADQCVNEGPCYPTRRAGSRVSAYTLVCRGEYGLKCA